MRIKPSLGLVVGPVNATHWSQVLTMPSAYGVVEVRDPSGHAQEHGVRVLSQLGEGLNHEILSLRELEKICDAIPTEYLCSLIVFVPVGKVIYLVMKGKGIVYVKRGSELASLMHQDGSISGEVKIHDTLLLASEGFSGVLTHEELSGLFDHLPPSEIAEKLTLLLHEKTGGEGSVALVFGVTEFIDPEVVVLEHSEDKNFPSIVEEISPDKKVGVKQVDEPVSLVSKVGNKFLHVPKISLKELIAKIKSQPKIITASFAIVFTLFFIVSVILGVIKQRSVTMNQKVAVILSQAQHSLDEGVALVELNPAKGRERLEEAKRLVEPLRETVSTRTMEGRRVAELYRTISDNLTQALHITKIDPVLYYDVSLVKKEGVIHSMARDGEDLVMSDSATSTIYRMDVASKNAQIIGGGTDMKGSLLVTSHGKKSYAMTDAGVMEISPGTKKPLLAIKKDEEWGTIQSVISFGGNIYLLDVIKSRIWKYVATEKSFSERREYLNPDTLPDLTRTSGMAIDGSVFMGNADGSILRFTQGKENTFIVKGVDPAFGPSPIVYASDDAKFIYVLDGKNSRIVVLDKEGMYVAQYQYSGEIPKQFVVYEELKKIVLLIGGKLYTIDLK